VVPAHARVASDSVFLHAARWPLGCSSTAALVLCTAVALSVWWCLPLRSFSAAVFTSAVFSILVWEGGAAVLLRFSVVVECRVLAALTRTILCGSFKKKDFTSMLMS
jgi:hypothetical protein